MAVPFAGQRSAQAVRTILSGPAAGVRRGACRGPSRRVSARHLVRHGGHLDRRESDRRCHCHDDGLGHRRLSDSTAGHRYRDGRCGRRIDRRRRCWRRAARGSAKRRRRSGARLLRPRRRTDRHGCQPAARSSGSRALLRRPDVPRRRSRQAGGGRAGPPAAFECGRPGRRRGARGQRQHGARHSRGLAAAWSRPAPVRAAGLRRCGGMHACEIASRLEIQSVLMPPCRRAVRAGHARGGCHEGLLRAGASRGG